jgi:hypothetical protein
LIACVGLLFAVVLLSHLTGSLLSLIIGILSTLAAAAAGMLWPHTLSFLYRAWNRLARQFSKLARLWVLGTTYYLVIVAVGRAGSFLRLHRPEASASLWMPRKALAPNAYGRQHATPTSSSPFSSWIASYLSWTVQTRNYWASCLLPFLVLLWALEPEQETNVPTDLYTLF